MFATSNYRYISCFAVATVAEGTKTSLLCGLKQTLDFESTKYYGIYNPQAPQPRPLRLFNYIDICVLKYYIY